MADVMNHTIPVEWVTPECGPDCEPKDDSDDDCESCNEETWLACPECGDPGDYCPSVHHWCCNECGHLLEENPNNEQWECWNLECKAYPND